jgi:hypothetical protein
MPLSNVRPAPHPVDVRMGDGSTHRSTHIGSENIPIEGADNAEAEQSFVSHCLLLLMLLLFVLMFCFWVFGILNSIVVSTGIVMRDHP